MHRLALSGRVLALFWAVLVTVASPRRRNNPAGKRSKARPLLRVAVAGAVEAAVHLVVVPAGGCDRGVAGQEVAQVEPVLGVRQEQAPGPVDLVVAVGLGVLVDVVRGHRGPPRITVNGWGAVCGLPAIIKDFADLAGEGISVKRFGKEGLAGLEKLLAADALIQVPGHP